MGLRGHRLFAILLLTACQIASGTICTYSIYYFDVSSNTARLREVSSIDCEHGCCGVKPKYCCNAPDTEEDGLSHVAIAGIVIGSVVAVLALTILGVCLFRRTLLNTKSERSRPTTTAIVSSAQQFGHESERPSKKTGNRQHSTAVTNHFYDNPRFINDDNIIHQSLNKSNAGKTSTNQLQTQKITLNNTANIDDENSGKVPNEDFKFVQEHTRDGMEQAEQRWSDREQKHGAAGHRLEGNGIQLQPSNLGIERKNVRSQLSSQDLTENGIGAKQDMAGHVSPIFEANKNAMTSKRRLFGSQQYLASNATNGTRYFDSGLSYQKYKSEMHLAGNEYEHRQGQSFTGSTHQLFTPNPRQQSSHPKTYKSTPNLFTEESPRPKLSLPPESRLDYYRYNISKNPEMSSDKPQTSTPNRPSNTTAEIPEYHTQYAKKSGSGDYRRHLEEHSQTKDKYFMVAAPTATITLPQSAIRKPQISDSSI